MKINYEVIKEMAKDEGMRISDFIALAGQNDPFYTGTPGDVEKAEWFSNLWHQFGFNSAHLRRMHYQIVSQNDTVVMPNGKPYENTTDCWEYLLMAGKVARYLDMVDAGNFQDRRNESARSYFFGEYEELRMYVYGNGSRVRLPDMPDMPDIDINGYQNEQLYHVEIWCEKSTMEDVILPLCNRYGCTYQTGKGELSITNALECVQRVEKINKPTRILYVSDFDPAGRSMPVAIGRKLEYFTHKIDPSLDIRLFPVVLTPEQCKTYNLPRTPIKKTEKRAKRFEKRYGSGATELDALEALYPGELENILREYIEHYFDTSLNDRIEEQRQAISNYMQAERDEIIASYQDEIDDITSMYLALRGRFEHQLKALGITERLEQLHNNIRTDLHSKILWFDEDDYPLPDPVYPGEIGPGLYNSERDYFEQLAEYKKFQGKE